MSSVAVEVSDLEDVADPESTKRLKLRANAIHRLSEIELESLGTALKFLDTLETSLLTHIPLARSAATKERTIRAQKGLPLTDGPYSRGHSAMLALLNAIEIAREETQVFSKSAVLRPPNKPRQRKNINN